jgi:hypothetical protein
VGLALLLAAGVLALCCCVDASSEAAATVPTAADVGPAATPGLAASHDSSVGVAAEPLSADDACDVHSGATDASPASAARPSAPASQLTAAEPSRHGPLLIASGPALRHQDRATPRQSPYQLCVMRT